MNINLFWKKINKTEGCWIWTGAARDYRYGIFRVSSKKVKAAHRIMYELKYGPIPDGMSIMHKCDNTRCVNPDHLVCGTHKDNMLDMQSKGRARKGLPDSKRAMVKPMRERGIPVKEIAKLLGASITHIRMILRGADARNGHYLIAPSIN